MKKDYFHVSEVDPQELFCILLDHFSQAEGTKFQRPGTQHFLELILDDAGKIKHIQWSKGFPTSELEEIEKIIQDALFTKHETKVHQVIAFCDTQITGYFRYKDMFQVLPMPEDAPKPKFGRADYPFILEVSYETSRNWTIEAIRQKEKAVLYTRLLNLLSEQAISLGRQSTHSGWVLKTEDPSNITSEWKEVGFMYPGLKGTIDDFSSVENINPIERVPFKTYYTALPARTISPLKLSDDLERSLDKAFALDKSTWRKFFMACSWYAQYRYIWEVSHSSAFIALVTAVECLAQEKEVCDTCKQPILENDEDICPSCKQPRYHVTKHFQDFLKKYFPAIDQFPKEKKTLYNVRSQLAHGSNLLQADLEPWNFFLDVKRQEQYYLQRNLDYIVGIAIYIWLLSVTTSP